METIDLNIVWSNFTSLTSVTIFAFAVLVAFLLIRFIVSESNKIILSSLKQLKFIRR